jgi:hypothetical protein
MNIALDGYRMDNNFDSHLSKFQIWTDAFCLSLSEIDSEEKLQHSTYLEDLLLIPEKIETLFEKLMVNCEQSVDLDLGVQRLCETIIKTDSKFIVNRPRHPHPFHHPVIAQSTSDMLSTILPILHKFFMKWKDDKDFENKCKMISETYARISLSSLERFAYAFHSRNFVNPMGGVEDGMYTKLKPWMQGKIHQAMSGADRAEEIQFTSLYCDLLIHACEIITYFRTPYRVKDLCDFRDGYHNIDFFIRSLESVNALLLEKSNWENSIPIRRNLLHRCREVRGFFQLYFQKFKSETDWQSAIMKAQFRSMSLGENIDPYFLADLGVDETIGGFGKPF